LEQILADLGPGFDSKKEIAEGCLKWSREFEKMKEKPDMPEICVKSDRWFQLLREGQPSFAQVLFVAAPGDRVRGKAYGYCRVWLVSPGKRIRGFADFLKQDGDWKWLPWPDPNVAPPTYWRDLSTPSNAFVSLCRAFDLARDRVPDVWAIYESIDSDLKRGVSLEQYEELVRTRAGDIRKAKPADFTHYKHLEEGILTTEGGKQRCKVWRLDEARERIEYMEGELFAKEGNDWKWVPAAGSVWNPAAGKRDK
jgi:hypothetical protein